MKWFNYNQSSKNEKTLYKQMGTWFLITCKSGFTYHAKYCQIASNTYRFIKTDGNRIVDDNREIVKIEPSKIRKKK